MFWIGFLIGIIVGIILTWLLLIWMFNQSGPKFIIVKLSVWAKKLMRKQKKLLSTPESVPLIKNQTCNLRRIYVSNFVFQMDGK
jgi:ABC-type antimicrobial peptide transport system permease subunit